MFRSYRIVIAIACLLAAFTDVDASDIATNSLPEDVAEMRNAILDAAGTREIEEMGVPIELNELPPTFGDSVDLNGDDPVAALRKLAPQADEVALLKLLEAILLLPATRDGDLYVWPYLVSRDPRTLNPGERADLDALLKLQFTKGSRETAGSHARYTGYRVDIGKDGTWHYFGPAGPVGELQDLNSRPQP